MERKYQILCSNHFDTSFSLSVRDNSSGFQEEKAFQLDIYVRHPKKCPRMRSENFELQKKVCKSNGLSDKYNLIGKISFENHRLGTNAKLY